MGKVVDTRSFKSFGEELDCRGQTLLLISRVPLCSINSKGSDFARKTSQNLHVPHLEVVYEDIGELSLIINSWRFPKTNRELYRSYAVVLGYYSRIYQKYEQACLLAEISESWDVS